MAAGYKIRLRSFLFWVMILVFNVARPSVSPTPGEITIMATTVFHDDEMPDMTVFKGVEDCGFNVICQNSSMEIFDSVFSMLRASPIKVILSNSAIYDGSEECCKKWIDKYRFKKNLGGWCFKDEPKYDNLDKYSVRYRFLKSLVFDDLIYLNLVGGTSSQFLGDSIKTIPDYLELIDRKFCPDLWSYDFYPLNVSESGELHVDYDTFYSDLEAFSNISKKTGIPFWAYCQSVGYRMNKFMRPVPKEEYLRFEAFSALAYGAQGIVYWTYMQRPDVESIDFEYLDAPVRRNGEKTKVWYFVRNVNMEIKKYNDVFCDSKIKKVVHTGACQYKGTSTTDGKIGPFVKVKSESSGVLISLLNAQNRNYVVIVNHDVKNRQRIVLEKKKGCKVMCISEDEDMFENKNVCQIDLKAGGYAIFEFHEF